MNDRQTLAIVQHAQQWAEARERRLAIGRELRQRQKSAGDWMLDFTARDLSQRLSLARRDELRASRALAKLFAPDVIRVKARLARPRIAGPAGSEQQAADMIDVGAALISPFTSTPERTTS